MSEKSWFWKTGEGKTVEQASWSDFVAAIERGEVDAATNVSNDGRTWRPGGACPEAAEALAEKAKRDKEAGERSSVEKETREEKEKKTGKDGLGG